MPPKRSGVLRISFHIFAAAWVLLMLLWARYATDTYAAAMQEDGLVEWWTVGLFLMAGIVRGRDAIRQRHVFDGLIALFCLFVAGEEISWGQRLLGFIPPASFLATNTQQEFNLHNFAAIFGRPKWVLIAAIAAYGVILPLMTRIPRVRAFAQRVGATIPNAEWLPWFATAVALLFWYPVEYTGEWVEFVAGALFLVAAPSGLSLFWLGAGATLAAAAFLAKISQRSSTEDQTLVACAVEEVAALARDLQSGEIQGNRLRRARSVHKRVYTAGVEGYIDLSAATAFGSARCAGVDSASVAARRRYLVDPWGTAYWIDADRPVRGQRRVVIYSFGPNRRRDGKSEELGPTRVDDIAAIANIPAR